MEPETIGARLRRLREERGLSQRSLAGPKCTAAYLSRIENGQRIPTVDRLREIAGRLDVSLQLLETGSEDLVVSVPISSIDADQHHWHPGFTWGDLTTDERRRVTYGLQDALLDTLSARIYAVAVGREMAAEAEPEPAHA